MDGHTVKLSDFVVEFIARQGVQHVFMLPGGGAMHLNDSLGRNKKIEYICTLHEQAAAIAADAYSQYTNNLGVVQVTTGPGGTNTITGVAASWLDSIPVLYISGQVKTADLRTERKVRQMGFQEVDIVQLVEPITKYAATVTDPQNIQYHLQKALHLAKSGRPGPVWIDIPLDVQAAEIDPAKLKSYDNRNEVSQPVSLSREVQSAIDLINHAKRPVILAGNGIRLSGALTEFLQLMEIAQIPTMTTWKALDFLPESHPLYIGRPGAVGQRGANFAQQTADLILILGARLDLGQTAYNHKNFAPHAKKIMVDVDPQELKKMETKLHLPIAADVRLFIQELLKNKSKIQTSCTPWLKQCHAWKKKYPVILPEYWTQKKYVNDYVLLKVLSDEMSKSDLLVPGSSGACSERTMQAFEVKKGVRVLNSQALGSMGFGLAQAIGACLASGKKRTVSIEGDGGFIMNVQELELVRRMNLPIKFFILNNEGYVSIRTTQINYFNKNFVASTPKSGLTLPNYKKIAGAFDIPYVQLKDQKNIQKKIKDILKSKGPVLCEVMVSPDQITQPRVSSKKLEDGKMMSMPMEDLWPFLDRAEFEENMKVIQDE